MTRTTKLILIASGIIVFLIIGVVVAGIILVVHFEMGESKRGYEAKEIEGREFGKQTDETGCMNEGLARKRDESLGSEQQCRQPGIRRGVLEIKSSDYGLLR